MDFTQIVKDSSAIFQASPVVKKDSLPLKILILSPHPDDECIVGSLALRLKIENQAEVLNVAVTLGSKEERQTERSKELKRACEVLGFKTLSLSESWRTKETELKELLKKHQPDLILAPHLKDHHPTHIKTGELLKKCLPKKLKTVIAWTEFWAPMSKPNLLLEVPHDILALQMQALSLHTGEVKRNPYHLRLPAWMIDNVRRGSEIVSGKGTESPKMPFGVLYKLQVYHNGKYLSPKLPSSVLSNLADLGEIIKSLN